MSYGEFGRVGGRVLIPVPIGDVDANPKLQILSIDEALVDWQVTEAPSLAYQGSDTYDAPQRHSTSPRPVDARK